MAEQVGAECARIAGSHGKGWTGSGWAADCASAARQRYSLDHLIGDSDAFEVDLVQLSGIGWRVLDVDSPKGRALLLADRVIGTGPYHKTPVAVTWEECDLRRWLNREFLGSLGDPLTSRIPTMKICNGPNPINGANGGDTTQDQVFLLSMEEAASFLTGKKKVRWKKYQTARWFKDQSLIARDEKNTSTWWWLRSPGAGPESVSNVHADGSLDGRNDTVGVAAAGGVRPAFWLNLES
jgi:hypothetical protein